MKHLLALFLSLFFCFSLALASPEISDLKIAPQDQAALKVSLISLIKKFYVFPEVGTKIDEFLAHKSYNGISSAMKLAEVLSEDLYELTKDKHLKVMFSAGILPPDPLKSKVNSQPPLNEEQLKVPRIFNFGFRKVSWLPGNIGLIKFDSFDPLAGVKNTIASVMQFVENTDALIFDIRENHGGDPETIAFISSYLFGKKPVHLNDLYWRTTDSLQQFWTVKQVPGKRFPMDKPVYVLTSGMTFSAAEEFAYNLKSLKRATIIGESTAGGANPGDVHRLSDHFSVFVPNGRAINPITHTNWEGTGVQPDVSTKAPEALKIAYGLALSSNIERSTSDKDKSNWLNSLLQDFKSGKLQSLNDN